LETGTIQFRLCGLIERLLVKPSVWQTVRGRAGFQNTTEEHAFGRVRSYVSASDFFQVPLPGADYSDSADYEALRLKLTDKTRKGF
jgi:hypothetical protein